jgi:hypothetical protein
MKVTSKASRTLRQCRQRSGSKILEGQVFVIDMEPNHCTLQEQMKKWKSFER